MVIVPKILQYLLEGDGFEFSENFKLNGTLHETGISEYYTWDYDGEKSIVFPTQKRYQFRSILMGM